MPKSHDSFFDAVVTIRYPTTNNQLRNSSNPRQQATINNGRVTLQPIQGRQTSFAAGTSRTYTPGASGSNSGKQRTVICYNCKGEDALAKVHNHDHMNNDVVNQAVQMMPSSQQSNVVNHSETKITSDSNIIPYSQYVIESQQATVQKSNSSAQQDDLILSVIEQLKTQEKVLEITSLKDDLRKLKGKALVDNVVTKHIINSEMLKIDVEPITPKLLNKRTTHSAYIKHTQEEAAVYKDLFDHVKANYPLDHSLESAC
ncbi:hypothetical protein Tco_0803280, partial [Tanacetum coccineum]